MQHSMGHRREGLNRDPCKICFLLVAVFHSGGGAPNACASPF